MRRTSKIIVAVIVIAMLLLGVGYAAIQNVTLNIQGTATAEPSLSNFKVMFSGTPTVSDEEKVTAAVTDETNATINVEGLTTEGETITVTYTVQNASTDLSSDLSVQTTNSNTEYFTIKSELAKTSLIAGEATTLTVTVELIKVPTEEKISSTIGVQITAMPVQPGEEGTESLPQEPEDSILNLSAVTNDNIGDYIDLGNNVVGTESTTDDWRILYVEEGTVYAILADYMPNDLNGVTYAADAGLDTLGTYNVYSKKDRDTLLTGLITESNWNGLAEGIEGATVIGSTTADLLFKSLNLRNGTDFKYTDCTDIISKEEDIVDYDLYIPNFRNVTEDCWGYWFATPARSDSMWYLDCGGLPEIDSYDYTEYGIRPLVSLPASTRVDLIDGIWTVVK